LKLAIWSPLPPAPSGIADYVAESLPLLSPRCDVVAVVEDPAAVDGEVARHVPLVCPAELPPVDLDLYHLGNSPSHGYAYRAAARRPGVVVLHEWSLHDLVRSVTLGQADLPAYLREMRHSHGPAGTFVGRQVVRGMGGELPTLFALNDRILEASLAMVGTTRFIVEQAAQRHGGLPVRHIPLHAPLFPHPLPDRVAARRALGLPANALVITAPGLATRAKRLDVAIRAVARLRQEHPTVRLVVAGPIDETLPLEAWRAESGLGAALVVTGRIASEDLVRHLVAADVVLALRHPSRGEMSAVLLRALAVGRPTLVTAGTPMSREFPEGVIVGIDPGRHEEAILTATIDALARRPALCAAVGRVARSFVRQHHDPEALAAQLVEFLAELAPQRDVLRRRVAAARAHDGTLLGELLAEVREAAREVGMGEVPPGCEEALASLVGGRRG
jgi:glycosyltransferase involved in cell wall biosynthesis